MNVKKSKTLWALIPSAGQNSRMGQTKALLSWQGQSFLQRVSRAIADSHLFAGISVITGHDRPQVETATHHLGLRAIHNANYVSGMMSSLQAGIRALPEDVDAVLIALVDQPHITAEFVQDFTQAFLQQSDQLSLARIQAAGKPSPPCLIAKKHFAEILAQEPTDAGAQFLFKKYPNEVLHFLTDEKMAQDIDTPSAYRELIDAQ